MFGFHLLECSKDVIETCLLQKKYTNFFCMKHRLDMYDVIIPKNKINCTFLEGHLKVPFKLKNARILTFGFRIWIFFVL